MWKDKGLCKFNDVKNIKHFKESVIFECPINCSYSDLEFTKEEIEKRIKKERTKATWLYYTAKDRRKIELMDKVAGVYLLSQALEDFFGVENPIKKQANIYMTENDRAKTIIDKKGDKK